jgi:hypothetical protein
MKWVERIGIAVILILSAVILFSCGNVKPNQRKAVKHYEKAKKYGLVITYPSQDTIRVTKRDTIVGANGTMKIFETVVEYVKIPCPEVEFPKSKTEIRQEARTERAEIRNDRKENKQNKKAETKINNSDNKADTKQTRIIKKQETKQLNCWNWWDKLKFFFIVAIPAYLLGLITRWILKLVKKIKLGLFSWYGNSH